MTTRVAALASISIDCPDPDSLAPFYCGLLGLEEVFATPDRGVVALSGAGPMLTLMRVEAHEPASCSTRSATLLPQRRSARLTVAENCSSFKVHSVSGARAAAPSLGGC